MGQQTGDIIIDEHFARFGSKSYALDKINTVDVRAHRTGGFMWVLWAIFGVLFALAALGNLANGMSGGILLSFAIAALFIFIAWRGRQKANTIWHQLILATSNGDAQAMQSTDHDEVLQLRAALEKAIAARG
jgi:hypothetical protein